MHGKLEYVERLVRRARVKRETCGSSTAAEVIINAFPLIYWIL